MAVSYESIFHCFEYSRMFMNSFDFMEIWCFSQTTPEVVQFHRNLKVFLVYCCVLKFICTSFLIFLMMEYGDMVIFVFFILFIFFFFFQNSTAYERPRAEYVFHAKN